jgi:hypothetical protein
MTWISVNDKLPDTLEQVLVLDSQGGHHLAIYIAEYDQWFSADNNHFFVVTHWMPIPKCVDNNIE